METSFWIPKIDLVEREYDYLVKIGLSEVYPSDVKITVAGNILSVRGKRSFDEDHAAHVMTEREYGCFVRKIVLSPLIDAENIEAELDDGLLFLVLPKNKKDNALSTKIEIK